MVPAFPLHHNPPHTHTHTHTPHTHTHTQTQTDRGCLCSQWTLSITFFHSFSLWSPSRSPHLSSSHLPKHFSHACTADGFQTVLLYCIDTKNFRIRPNNGSIPTMTLQPRSQGFAGIRVDVSKLWLNASARYFLECIFSLENVRKYLTKQNKSCFVWPTIQNRVSTPL